MSAHISAIVPIYNVKEYLDQCVESILSQKYAELEIILVDDGSSDYSCELCDCFSCHDSCVTVIHKKNGGLTSARKVGILTSSGHYVMIVDGDDWIDVKTIPILADKIQLNPDLDLLLFSHQKEYPYNSYTRHLFDKDILFDNEKIVKENLFRRLFGLRNMDLNRPLDMDYLSTCWGKLYRRDLALKAKFVDTSEVGSGEDGIFNLYVLDSCKSALYIDQPLYHYRYTSGSLTLRYRNRLAAQWRKLFSYMQRKLDKDDLSSDFQEALNNRIALSVLGIGMNEMDNPNGSFIQFTGYMKRYISSPDYRAAISTMRLKKLPLPWRVLMLCCKLRFGLGVAVILKAIRMIKNRL